MFDKLESVVNRYEQIGIELTRPDVASNNEVFTKLMKEHAELTPIVEKYREYTSAKAAEKDALEILAEPNLDKDFKELAEEELKTAKENIEIFRGGAGGEEAALFAGSLYRMYTMYAEANRWQVEVMSANETELGGYKEICFMIEGNGAYSKFKYESGVHRVQRVPDTETQGRIHTSTVTVAVLPEADDVELEINPADLKIDTFRSSGAGGQHINKTSSAIRVTHIPTGTVVECQDERSQFKNKDKALKILRSRLLDEEQRKHDEAIASDRKNQVGTGDRSERIRTYNYPQGRVTDHRIGLTLYKLEQILNGDMTEVVDALITYYRTEALKSEEEA